MRLYWITPKRRGSIDNHNVNLGVYCFGHIIVIKKEEPNILAEKFNFDHSQKGNTNKGRKFSEYEEITMGNYAWFRISDERGLSESNISKVVHRLRKYAATKDGSANDAGTFQSLSDSDRQTFNADVYRFTREYNLRMGTVTKSEDSTNWSTYSEEVEYSQFSLNQFPYIEILDEIGINWDARMERTLGQSKGCKLPRKIA